MEGAAVQITDTHHRVVWYGLKGGLGCTADWDSKWTYRFRA